MSSSPDVVVVGGGVVGCSIAFHLARAGLRTTVVERGRLGAQASAAASGVLSPSPGSHPYATLGRESHEMFHKLAPELMDAGGVDIELARCGELQLALSEGEAGQLRGMVESFNELGSTARWLDQRAVQELEPELNRAVLGAMHLLDVSRVNNQRLTEAFARAAISLGTEVRQGSEVVGLMRQGRRITGVRLYDHDLSVDHVVIAAGAWSGVAAGWLGLPQERSIPVHPVRGQNVNLQPTAGCISSVVHGSWGILVPRNDGSVIAGATVEEVGFDARVTAGGVQSILGVAAALMPSLQDATFNWSIAGLRPGSPDEMPLLGPVPGWDGLSLASGHYRNGILLSPVTGQLIADQLTGDASDLLSAFSPDRFGTAE